MRRAIITCNQVQTEVITEGRWIEESPLPHSSKHMILVLPGNPSVPRFYGDFMKTLSLRLTSDIPVWLIGHAGHAQPPNNLDIAIPSDEKWTEYYGLTAQIQQKVEFIKKYVPEDAQLHLIGHSIGAWMVLNLLKNNDINKRIKKCYLLFPVIENMADTPNGRFFNNFTLRIAPVLIFLSWIFTTVFPSSLQVLMIRIFGLLSGFQVKSVTAIQEMLNLKVFRRVIYLGKDEMKCVREVDHEIISKNSDKLWFYYGATDGWAPKKIYENMISKYPNLNAQLCQHGFQHAFVLKDSVAMGHIVGDLINEHSKY